ncbi:MAG: DEAD/DEAH box helicase [Chlamydiae bacterium]|nr:DEAD/DEAH box helicase [Chlamydiota bacterium]
MKITGEEFIDSIFSNEGILSNTLKDYELREEQRQMSLQVLEAYSYEKIALIEAGTGVGKSWAYLIPAIYWAVTHGEQTVISTHTIPLQEQLTEKDIPFLLKTLNIDLRVVLVKGMNNYLCLKKLGDITKDTISLLPDERDKIDQLHDFTQVATEGSYSDIPFSVPQSLWDQISADRSTCTNVQCPSYKECYFFKARKKMSEAQILIVNHHLLMADLASRIQSKSKEEKSVLPKFHRLIIDEAHHIDEIALESFARKNDKLDLIRWLGRIFSDHHPEKSRCSLFLKDLISLNANNLSLEIALQTDIPGEKRTLVLMIEEMFKKFEFFCQTYMKDDSSTDQRELKWRLKAENLLSEYWQQEVKPKCLEVADGILKIALRIGSLRSQLPDLEKHILEKLSPHLQELEFVASNLTQKANDLKSFVTDEEDLSRVRWIELTGFLSNMMLVDAHLNVAEYLKMYLFDPRVSSVLCSATLTSSNRFDYVKDRLGLGGKSLSSSISEKIYPSPFDYENRVLLAVPKDICLPSDSTYTKEVASAICSIVKISRGSCFVLFTSYEMLRQVHRLVENRLKDFNIMKQGDASRQVLIDTFKAKEGNVLFATDSFWEGVDVPGEALRCVIIVKLPFKVPSDPMYQAFSELFAKQNKDPFSMYSLPYASIKFKQGFGRLIRKNSDRGCVICLDKRIKAKSYGSVFLKSIPLSKRVYDDFSVVFSEMQKFYVSTETK